jgi:acyl-CoA synthetase (AMP-forming)/AMP-acid ligase II
MHTAAVQPRPPVASLWQLLSDHATHQPDKPAVMAVDVLTGAVHTLTYAQLRDAVVRCANELHDRYGVRAGGCFGFAYDNRIDVLALELAGGLLGASSVPLDARRDVAERMQYKLGLSGASVMFTQPAGSGEAPWREKVAGLRARLPDLPLVAFEHGSSLLDEIAERAATPAFAPVDDLEHVLITLFTSGTTADPKGVQLTAANLLYNAHGVRRWLRIGRDDRFGAILPLHHINSTVFALATLLAGGTLVLFSEPPKDQFWPLVARHRVTLTSIVQKMLYELLDLPFEAPRDLALSRIQIGSDVVDPVAAEHFVEHTGIPLYQGYGLTETAFRVSGMPMDLPWEDYLTLVRRNTIGAALENVEIAIRPLNGAGEAGPGEQGEIVVRGPIVMQGYLKNPGATAEALADGWLHTRELGWYEELFGRRFFFYHSRMKDIIKKGGALLSPAAIDRAVRARFPELAEACAFGYPSRAWGEEIWMVVIFREDVPPARRAEILAAIVADGQAERIPGLPKFEAPARVLDWRVHFPGEELPRTSTLKVQLSRLKEHVVQRFRPQ